MTIDEIALKVAYETAKLFNDRTANVPFEEYFDDNSRAFVLANAHALIAELAKQEPVAKVVDWPDDFQRVGIEWLEAMPPVGTKLYAAPIPPAVPEGWKLLKDSTLDERTWHEDDRHENGNYFKTCCNCGRTFVGHKRRVTCKVCAAPIPKEES